MFGGYRRVEGYSKFDTAAIPNVTARVNGSVSNSTTLTVDNKSGTLTTGMTVNGANVSGTVTIASITSQTSGAATVELSGNQTLPDTTATANVNGAVSSSTAVVLDGNSGTITAGMIVTGTGISGTVTVTTVTDQNNITLSSAQTLADDTALSFADDVELTFNKIIRGIVRYDGKVFACEDNDVYFSTGSGWTKITDSSSYGSTGVTVGGTGKVRFVKYDFDGTEKFILVDGTGKPYRFDGTTFSQLSALSSDTSGASFAVNFKNHIVFGNGKKLIFTAPFEDDDDSVANGGLLINVTDTITGLIVFREQLVVFSESSINIVRGTSVGDFTLQPVSRDLGAIAADTIQEIGGDIIFLGPDGLRLFSATDRVGDFSLGVVSKPIQTETIDLIASSPGGFNSTVIREKSQYRIFGYNEAYQDDAAKAIAGTQLEDGIKWNDMRGINAFATFSEYDGSEERIYFGNINGYVYQMESGNTFDGENIIATFATPFFPLEDPEVRKTIYKGTTYLDVNGDFDLEFSMKFDFDQPDSVQPDSVLSSDSSVSVSYGSGIYGTSIFGGKQKAIYEVQTIGSGFTVSMLYETTGTNTDAVFSVDAATLEYAVNDRR